MEENMDYKKIVLSVISVVVVAMMIGTSELLQQREIIFPEATSVLVGLFLSPKRSWQVSKPRIFVLIGICSALGLMISVFLPLPLWIKLSIAFIICQFILLFSRTSFAPLISAAVLPVMLCTESLVCLIAAVGLTGIILLIYILLEKLHITEKEEFIPLPPPSKSDYSALLLRCAAATACICLAVNVNFLFAVAPPILVAFTELTRKESMARQKPIKAVGLIFVCTLAGALCRYILTVRLNLSLTLAAVAAAIIMVVILHAFKMYLPPAGALTILAMLVPTENLMIYPLEVLIGTGIFMALAILINKKRNKNENHNYQTNKSNCAEKPAVH